MKSLPVILLSITPLVAAPSAPIVIEGSDHRLMVDPRGRVCALEIDPVEFARWDNFAETTTDARRSSNRIYEHFQDAFDFILFIDNVNEGGGGGRHRSVRNDIGGIGSSNFDFTSTYGSAGQLQSVIHLTNPATLRGGPSLHEIMHRWGNRLDPIYNGGAHWGFSSAGGQLGGWKPGTLVDLGGGVYDADGFSGSSFGTIANGGNSLPYSPIELYLMGLIPSTEVDPLLVARGTAWQNSSQGIFTATSIDTVTIEQIIAAEGARAPDQTGSQTSFKALCVLLTPDPVEELAWDDMDADVQSFCIAGSDGSSLYNFYEATGGRATISMDGITSLLLPGKEALTITPSSGFHATSVDGGAFDVTETIYTLTNDTTGTIDWTATGPDWLSFAPASGTLTSGQQILVTVSLDSGADSFGRQSGEIRFQNISNGVYSEVPTSLAIAETLYMEDFETGSLGSEWTLTGTNDFRLRIADYFFPQGNYHAILDDAVNDSTYSRTELTLTVNAEGWEDLVLHYDAKEYGDESHGPAPYPFTGGADFDGIAVRFSDTLDEWYQVDDFFSLTGSYDTYEVDLDQVLASLGEKYSSAFQIRFNQFDNYALTSDGITLDNIRITGTPPPPKILSLDLSGGNATIRMKTRTGHMVSLERAFDLTGPWETISGPVSATSGEHVFNATYPAVDKCFFRCREE